MPARKICSLEEYLKKVNSTEENLWFEEDFTMMGGITKDKKQEMKERLEGGKIGLVR